MKTEHSFALIFNQRKFMFQIILCVLEASNQDIKQYYYILNVKQTRRNLLSEPFWTSMYSKQIWKNGWLNITSVICSCHRKNRINTQCEIRRSHRMSIVFPGVIYLYVDIVELCNCVIEDKGCLLQEHCNHVHQKNPCKNRASCHHQLGYTRVLH